MSSGCGVSFSRPNRFNQQQNGAVQILVADGIELHVAKLLVEGQLS